MEFGISPIFSFLGPGLSPQPSQDPESLEKEQETQSPRSAWPRVDIGRGVGTESRGWVMESRNRARLAACGAYMVCTASSEAPRGRGP